MFKKFQDYWRKYQQERQAQVIVETDEQVLSTDKGRHQRQIEAWDISPTDPLLTYFLSSPGVVEIDKLNLTSPTLDVLRDKDYKLALPLVSQGELIGLINLGPRLSEQEYSTDDKNLLNNLATQAAPALRVAQLARQQQAEALQRERLAHELRVARIIQETLLPKEIPQPEGWSVAALWQPAQEVGGDFYDFFPLPDGRLGIIIADVTDKGVPAAMVMATTRSILRAVAERCIEPGLVLENVNNQLVPDIPTNMFVTCLYLILNLSTAEVVYANAGHNLPIHCTSEKVIECRVTGMPLGLMPDMKYEVKSLSMSSGDRLLLYSDGLSEAHNPDGEMFGIPRIRELLSDRSKLEGEQLIDYLFRSLHEFTRPDWTQEDDVTFVTLERVLVNSGEKTSLDGGVRTLVEFELPSEPGNERQAAERVIMAVEPLGLSDTRQKKLETAVAEATMNAMEHGNQYDPQKPVSVKVSASTGALAVRIIDYGGKGEIPDSTIPDLDAKLAGEQSPRGWGLFLIQNMVDDMRITRDATHHMMELIINLKGEANGQS
jgi:serine phosphatase RsbU (regulator of sigma subunit)/anti-sigma regulatory factor (Ser/Thr protein kinase)